MPSYENLISQVIKREENSLALLANKNKDILKSLNDKSELSPLNYRNRNIYNTIVKLLKDISLLDLYLANAKELEYLQVGTIEFVDSLKSFDSNGDKYYCKFRTDNNGKNLQFITKYYTDADVIPRPLIRRNTRNFNNILFTFSGKASFVLKTSNPINYYRDRKIEIIDFGFDGSKLPTKEELESYEIPRALILTDNK